MAIVPGVGYLIVNDILSWVSYSLFEPLVNTTITTFTVPAGYGDGGFGDGGYGDGTGLVVTVGSLTGMYVGAEIIVGLGIGTEEVVTILSIDPVAGTFTAAFSFAHSPGELIVGATFPLQQTTDPIWEQSEMLAYISTAYNDFLTACPLVYNVTDLTVVFTQQNAALPADNMYPVRMAVNSYPLRETSQSNLDLMVYRWQEMAADVPKAYFRDKVGLETFGIWPRANNNTTVECVYAQRGPQLFGLADGFSIPDPFLLYVFFRVLSFAYSKDGEGRNPGLARIWQQRYELGVKIANMFLAAINDPNLEMAQ
jgi:hypothetical protein